MAVVKYSEEHEWISIEGDIGNPASFDFPVIYRRMEGIGSADAVSAHPDRPRVLAALKANAEALAAKLVQTGLKPKVKRNGRTGMIAPTANLMSAAVSGRISRRAVARSAPVSWRRIKRTPSILSPPLALAPSRGRL